MYIADRIKYSIIKLMGITEKFIEIIASFFSYNGFRTILFKQNNLNDLKLFRHKNINK